MSGTSKTKLKEVLAKKITWLYCKNLMVNPSQLLFVAIFLVIIELVLNIFIVEKVPYTEIDWKAYMQECEGFLNGTLDYSKLRGDTGPLVYPAGFLYIYSFLYYVTNHGENIKVAQYVFICVYLLQLILVFRIYLKTKKVPPYALILAILTSYRIHSIYVLRLFNDPISVLLLYISLNLFLESKWSLASVFYSLGVSVKMNILLYAPALFFFYLVNLGLKETLIQLLVCGTVQLILGLPFLMSYPIPYLKGSFDIGRVFNHTWTVNYRFLDKEIFEHKYFHLSLLLMHVILLMVFIPLCVKYFQSYCRLRYVQKQVQPQIDAKNLENKKRKLRNESKFKSLKKTTEQEVMSKEQEDFLASFETMLKKSSNKSTNKQSNKQIEPNDNMSSNYSIDFDILSQLFILPMFTVNYIGIVCARSLHYQFYSWYFHSLPYILWSNNFSTIFRFLLLALVEMCWNTYPSTIFSSVTLHLCHVIILYGVYKKMSNELKYVAKVE